MNGRQRILAAFRGEQPDTVPFAPNIYQWFYYHYRNGTLPAEVAPGEPAVATEEQAETAPRPRFDFYTLLPEQTIDVEVDPAEVTAPREGASASGEVYLLQAGSFRQREDADRRRAELLLLGLQPEIEETSGDNGRWFRVYLGPFDSRSTMSRARSLTAGQDIDTLVLKRDPR